jgi:hypothetical protein
MMQDRNGQILITWHPNLLPAPVPNSHISNLNRVVVLKS